MANNVENINAVIYADGAFMSSSSSESYPPYNAEDLTKPLVIQGSLFTRNTIG
ncbi:MAG: hypothetical protein LBU14_00515 [Candidatus Peribacteria bacterium]|nr:hypothetical protein [Candidatus Peribacteria bacterium]